MFERTIEELVEGAERVQRLQGFVHVDIVQLDKVDDGILAAWAVVRLTLILGTVGQEHAFFFTWLKESLGLGISVHQFQSSTDIHWNVLRGWLSRSTVNQSDRVVLSSENSCYKSEDVVRQWYQLGVEDGFGLPGARIDIWI